MAQRDVAHEMVQTVWLGMALTHPAEWEPARLSLNPLKAGCTLVDRYGQRLSAEWRPIRATPDVPRIFRQYRRRAAGDFVEELGRLDDWQGHVRRDGDVLLTHAGRYFAGPPRLVEVVIPWRGPRDRALERKLLQGLAPIDPASPQRIWQALGLSVSVLKGSTMWQYVAQPGLVRFDFRSRDGHLSVERVGVVEQWLTMPLSQYLEGRAPQERQESAGAVTVNGHDGCEVLTSAASPLGRLLGRRHWRRQTAWICPADGRLYHVNWSHSGRQPRAVPEVEVGCCGPLVSPPAA